jgi:hypothetical protein
MIAPQPLPSPQDEVITAAQISQLIRIKRARLLVGGTLEPAHQSSKQGQLLV